MANNKLISYFDLTGKLAVVTGGYGHLGRTMVNGLYECGAKVVVAGKSKEKFLKAFSTVQHERISFLEIDVTDTNSIKKFFKLLMNEHDTLDIVVNNAHTVKGNSQENMSDEEWTYSMEGVVGSVHKMIRAVIPIMKKQKHGKILNITSMYGIVSPDFKIYEGDKCEDYINPPHYGAAKAAIIQLTKYYAVYLGKFGINVNAIAPGPFPNTATQEENPAFIEKLKEKNPIKKIGKPEDLIGTIILLSSKESDFITGQTIQVDGGWTIW